jgi:phage terminase small subunit
MSMQQRPLTQRQENFVRKVAEGMPASRAYREAGYTATAHAAEVMASKTLRNAEVAARLAELRAEQAKRHEVTIDSLAREFDENRAHALRVDQVTAAVQATAMKAKLFGFMVDRQQVQVEHSLRKPSADENAPAEMSLEDWQAKYGGGRGPVINGRGSGKLIEHEPGKPPQEH